MNFLKKYWTYILIGILLALLSLQQHCINGKIANLIAEKAKVAAMAKQNKKLTLLTDGYRKINAELYAKLGITEQELKDTGIEADTFAAQSEKRRKKILELSDFKDKSEKLNGELILANEFILTLRKEYTTNIEILDGKWRAIVTSKDKEISDLNALYGTLNAEYGDLVKKYTKCRLGASQRLILGPTAGIGANGSWFVGVGVTFKLFAIPLRMF